MEIDRELIRRGEERAYLGLRRVPIGELHRALPPRLRRGLQHHYNVASPFFAEIARAWVPAEVAALAMELHPRPMPTPAQRIRGHRADSVVLDEAQFFSRIRGHREDSVVLDEALRRTW